MRGEGVGLPLETVRSLQVQDRHLPGQQDTLKLSLEIYLHDEYQFSRWRLLKWCHMILESESTRRDECEGQKGTGFEGVLHLPTTQDRTHPQTYLVRYNNKCCLGANQSGLGFLPGIPHKKSTSKRSQLCILAQAASHLTWLHLLCQSNACILQHPITSHRCSVSLPELLQQEPSWPIPLPLTAHWLLTTVSG